MENTEIIHYVYCHFRNDTNELFYIGKGQKNRAYSKQRRNPYWKNVVNKANGYTVKIIATHLTNKEALSFERVLIKAVKDQHDVSLCNLTDGGDGALNPSKETREKQRAAKLGKKLSEEHKQKISESNKNRVVTEETRQKISKAHIGMPSKYKGIKRSPEVCLKISEAKKAKNMKHSDETKIKMSLAKQNRRKA